MKFFRPHISDDEQTPSGRRWKYLFWGTVTFLVVGSFIVQMSMGLCPVP